MNLEQHNMLRLCLMHKLGDPDTTAFAINYLNLRNLAEFKAANALAKEVFTDDEHDEIRSIHLTLKDIWWLMRGGPNERSIHDITDQMEEGSGTWIEFFAGSVYETRQPLDEANYDYLVEKLEEWDKDNGVTGPADIRDHDWYATVKDGAWVIRLRVIRPDGSIPGYVDWFVDEMRQIGDYPALDEERLMRIERERQIEAVESAIRSWLYRNDDLTEYAQLHYDKDADAKSIAAAHSDKFLRWAWYKSLKFLEYDCDQEPSVEELEQYPPFKLLAQRARKWAFKRDQELEATYERNEGFLRPIVEAWLAEVYPTISKREDCIKMVVNTYMHAEMDESKDLFSAHYVPPTLEEFKQSQTEAFARRRLDYAINAGLLTI